MMTTHRKLDGNQPADVLVVFGISGDLAKVMTFRSLYRLERRGTGPTSRPPTTTPSKRPRPPSTDRPGGGWDGPSSRFDLRVAIVEPRVLLGVT